MAKAAETKDLPAKAGEAKAAETKRPHVKGPGGKKHPRDFVARYVGNNGAVPKETDVTGCCDESEAIAVLRRKYNLATKDGRFVVTETPESREKSLQRLREREEAKKNKPATGGL